MAKSKKRPQMQLTSMAVTRKPWLRPSLPWVREFYVLPKTTAVNEAIGLEQKNIGGTETEVKFMYLPGYVVKQKVYTVDAIILKKLESFRSKDYQVFYRRKGNDTIHPFRPPEKISVSKDRRAKAALKKTRLVPSVTK